MSELLKRNTWCQLTDAQLLKQCEVDTYRASGPGGQKRNKTSSAVRLRHIPSGLLVIAEESRSQHENRAKALRRIRQAFYLKIRTPLSKEDMADLEYPGHELIVDALDKKRRLHLGKRDERFWPVVGVVLDVFVASEARTSTAASVLGITTANLIDFLQTSPKVWEQANHLRSDFGHKPLRTS